jgi:hypothetical protein
MDAVVYVIAFLFAAMGLATLARPQIIPATFGVTEATIESRNEIRAVYGGFGIAIAAVLVWAVASDPVERDGVLIAAAVALFGMAAGRVASGVIERGPARLWPVWAFGAGEVAMGALLLAAA